MRTVHPLLSEENASGTREGEGEPAEAQKGMSRYRRAVRLPITSTVLESDPKDITFSIAAAHVDVPREPAKGFSSLEDVLGAVSAVYMNRKVRMWPTAQIPL